ncbi:hypothetical protein ACF0H5_002197 [Mactra antiquata]
MQKMQTLSISKNEDGITMDNDSSDDEIVGPKTGSQGSKRISFPPDSILNAVIQDGDVMELLHILKYRRGEIDLNQKNHTGLTALHYAVLTNNLDSVKLLITNGANVCSQDEYGFSPLHTAAALGFLQVTTLLIVHGADVFSLTKHSELPVDLAKDISVIRVLSNEMCLKLHSEKYFKSMIFLAFRKTWRVLIECALYILKFVVFVINSISQRFSTKPDSKLLNDNGTSSSEVPVKNIRDLTTETILKKDN